MKDVVDRQTDALRGMFGINLNEKFRVRSLSQAMDAEEYS